MGYKLKIVHLGGVFFNGDINYCHVITLGGEMGIMPKHSPLISSLQVSGLKYVTSADNVTHECAIAGGILFVDTLGITILTSNIQNRQNIDIDEARKTQLFLESKLKEDNVLKNEEIQLRTALKQTNNLIHVKEKGI